MRIDFTISQSELGKFRTTCESLIRNVGTGTKAATERAGWEIMSDSLDQVPVETGTLISSSFLGVSRRTDVKNYRYGAVLGYGDQEHNLTGLHMGSVEWLMAPTNNINPKNGLKASAYAAVVHEDLDMPHPNGGKAKFLEDPVREWASGRYARTAMYYWHLVIQNYVRANQKNVWQDTTTGKLYEDINWIKNNAMRSRMRRMVMPDFRKSYRLKPDLTDKHTSRRKDGRIKPLTLYGKGGRNK